LSAQAAAGQNAAGRDRVRDVLAGLTLVALLVAGWFGYSWWSAAHDGALSLARDRDAALDVASTGLVVLNTFDYRTGEQDMDRWLAVTTGQLAQDLSGDRKTQLDEANSTKTIATSTLRQAAVTELNSFAGTAKLIAVLDVRLSTNGATSAPALSRLNVDLARTDKGWKVSAVQAGGQ
jgi:Mce-associated membrane protein